MSTKLSPVELKTVVSLAKQVKETENKKYLWSGLHRLVAYDGRLFFRTNDGQVWLTWNFQLTEPTPDQYDVAISASQFNDYISKSSDGTMYEIGSSGGLLQLAQGPRDLKIREESPKIYPEPQQSDAFAHYQCRTWTVSASLLARSLGFVAPFVDAKAAQGSVVTWGEDGRLVGGTVRAIGCVQGLPAPPVALSFRQKQAKAIISFLGTVDGDVQITDEGNICHFDAPLTGNRLTATSDLARSNMPADRSGREDEIFKIDGTRFSESVSILGSSLPIDMNQLQFGLIGGGIDSVLHLSNNLDGGNRSKDEVSIMRDFSSEPGSDVYFSVNNKVVESSINQMKGSILTGKYYKTGHFYIEDERSSADDVNRIAMIIVQDLSVPAQIRKGEEVSSATVS